MTKQKQVWTVTLKGQDNYNKWTIQADAQSTNPVINEYTNQPVYTNTQVTASTNIYSTSEVYTRKFLNTARMRPSANIGQSNGKIFSIKTYGELRVIEATHAELKDLIERTIIALNAWDWN